MMSVPNTSPGHQLATSGFEPIVSEATHSELERIEERLLALQKDEEIRIAARTNVLMLRREHDGYIARKRKREDDEFREITENAEAEEEGLRREKKKLKRESMGLFVFSTKNSPEAESSPMTAPAEPQMWASVNSQARSSSIVHSERPIHNPYRSYLPPSTQPLPHTGTTPRGRSASPVSATNGVRQRNYNIKNRALYDNRHGPADGYDNIGRPLWRRPSDGVLVYLICPFATCKKNDFRTIHGLTVHLTRIHKDKSARGHSQIIDACGSETPNPVHLVRLNTRPQLPPSEGNLVYNTNKPAINNISDGNGNNPNNTQSNATTPGSVSNHTQDPISNHAQNLVSNHTPDPVPNHAHQLVPHHTPDPVPHHTHEPMPRNAQDPVQNRQKGQETGYCQDDIVYSDIDDDEEMPQVKVETDPKDVENLSAEPSEQIEKNGDVQPDISATPPRID